MARLALALLLVLAAAPAIAQEEEPIFVDLGGRTVKVSDHRGEVVLLNFWATYCGPCRTEMPALQKLHAELGPKGLRVIGAAANGRDEGEAVKRALEGFGVTFEPWLWVSAKDMRHYGVGPGLPATVLIARDGTVRRRVQGIVDAEILRPIVEQLLAEPAPAAK